MKRETDKTALLFVESLFVKSCEKLGIDSSTFKAVQITGDASARRYYRLKSSEKSFIACLNNPDGTLLDFKSIQAVWEKEGVSVPQIYDFIENKGYLLQEDLGDKTLLKSLAGISNFNEELDIYKKIINELSLIHKIDNTKYLDKNFSRLSFDMPKYFNEINFTMTHLVEGLFGATLSDSDKKRITAQFELVCKPLANQKFVLTHRDFHSRNIMSTNSQYKIIDFQDARMGIPQYDLVSLIEDCYYSIDHKNKEMLKQYYWNHFLQETGFQSSYDEYLELYEYMTIQRTFKAMGSFAYIYKTREDERYLKYIGYSFEKFRRSLMNFSKLNELRSMIASMYYEY